MKLDVTAVELERLLAGRVSKERFEALRSIGSKDVPDIVYTSFDGDMLSHSELMKQHVLRKGLVPLNPESALGTYLVTNHYEGDKGPIIEDCLSLIGIVDHFYVMSSIVPKTESEVRLLPEGVIAEVLYWVTTRHEPVIYVDIREYEVEGRVEHTDELFERLDDKQKAGIRKAVDAVAGLRPVAYLLSGEMHAKHSDWMRKDAYGNKRVPLCPYTLINHSTLQLAYRNDHIRQLMCRVALALRAAEIRLYGPNDEAEFNIAKIPDDALVELYVVLRLQPQMKVLYRSFATVGVPKYVDRKRWAITDFEREQADE